MISLLSQYDSHSQITSQDKLVIELSKLFSDDNKEQLNQSSQQQNEIILRVPVSGNYDSSLVKECEQYPMNSKDLKFSLSEVGVGCDSSAVCDEVMLLAEV